MVAWAISFPPSGLGQELRAELGKQPGLALTLVHCLVAGST